MTPDATAIAARLDAAILRPDATAPEVHKVVTDAIQRGLRAVRVAPVYVQRVARMIQGEGGGVRVCTVVGWPFGTGKSTVKAIEATSTLKDGADEVVVAPFLPPVLAGDVEAVRAELLEIVRAARSTRREAIVHVLLESAALMPLPNRQLTIQAACRAVRESGCDGVVTASAYHPAGGTTAEAVALFKRYGEGLTVTGAGDIADVDAARALLYAGADCIASEHAAEILAVWPRG